MHGLLGKEFEAFAASFEQPGHRGLRVNTLKVSVEDFSWKRPFTLEPVGKFEPAGFRVVDESQPGSHPYHAAGLYYMQEPAAMTVGTLLRPQPGEWVLDLAAAPGGKSTHIASLMKDEGLLVANDVDRGGCVS
jgi:16S rRNA C967 or C1407 C5-methylase (RsmB/RsmF family)